MPETTPSLAERIRLAAARTHRSPSVPQRIVGNYQKGKFHWNGHEIAIESPKGSIREGVDRQNRKWSVLMPAHYGYIKRTLSEADGDAFDVIVGPHPESDIVFVVDQRSPGGRFDEHKAVVGCLNINEARRLYLACYSPGWQGLKSITPMTRQQFSAWLRSGNTGKPIAGQVSQYAKKSAKPAVGQQDFRWITIHPHGHEEDTGTPVKIDGNGNIVGGPKGIADKGIKKLSDFGKSGGKNRDLGVKKSDSPIPAAFQNGSDYSVSKSPNANQWIFKDKNGNEIGEIQLKKRLKDDQYVTANVLVWPQFQRKGWATKFYQEASKWAKSQGKKLYLSQDRSKDAQSLHEAFKKSGALRPDGQIDFLSKSEPTPGIQSRAELAEAKATQLKNTGNGHEIAAEDQRRTDAAKKRLENVNVDFKGIDYVPHPVARDNPDDFETVHADASKLDQEWAKDQSHYLPKEGKGQSEIEGRRDNFSEFMKSGQSIQQPHVVVNDSGRLAFEDGRHRARVLMNNGEKTIPLTVPKEDVERVKELVGSGESIPRTHNVKLPKSGKPSTIQKTAEALSQMGYELGNSKTDLKNKQTVYEITHPNGSKSTASIDEIREIIKRGHEGYRPRKSPDRFSRAAFRATRLVPR